MGKDFITLIEKPSSESWLATSTQGQKTHFQSAMFALIVHHNRLNFFLMFFVLTPSVHSSCTVRAFSSFSVTPLQLGILMDSLCAHTCFCGFSFIFISFLKADAEYRLLNVLFYLRTVSIE